MVHLYVPNVPINESFSPSCMFMNYVVWAIHSKSESRDPNGAAKNWTFRNFFQKCHEMAQKWPKVAQIWPKMAQKCPKWPKNDPKWPKNYPHFFFNFFWLKRRFTKLFAFRMYDGFNVGLLNIMCWWSIFVVNRMEGGSWCALFPICPFQTATVISQCNAPRPFRI